MLHRLFDDDIKQQNNGCETTKDETDADETSDSSPVEEGNLVCATITFRIRLKHVCLCTHLKITATGTCLTTVEIPSIW